MYWTALYGVQRTPRAAAVLDGWWLELRRWVYRDQVSLPYALWRVETGGGPSDSAEGIGPPRIALEELDGEQALCAFLVGDANKCCRRCDVPKALQGGGTSVGLLEGNASVPDEVLGLRRPASAEDFIAYQQRREERYQERMAEFRAMQIQRFHERQLNRSAYRLEQRKLELYLAKLANRTSPGQRWAALRAEREHERWVRSHHGGSYSDMKARQVLRKEKDEMMMKAGYIRIKRARRRPRPGPSQQP